MLELEVASIPEQVIGPGEQDLGQAVAVEVIDAHGGRVVLVGILALVHGERRPDKLLRIDRQPVYEDRRAGALLDSDSGGVHNLRVVTIGLAVAGGPGDPQLAADAYPLLPLGMSGVDLEGDGGAGRAVGGREELGLVPVGVDNAVAVRFELIQQALQGAPVQFARRLTEALLPDTQFVGLGRGGRSQDQLFQRQVAENGKGILGSQEAVPHGDNEALFIILGQHLVGGGVGIDGKLQLAIELFLSHAPVPGGTFA